MNYKETMNYIMSTGKFGSNLGLERTEKILELLGNPHKKIKCVHIAGTNGKGSATAMITNILIKAGYKVGMYTSPYLEEFEERIQINRENISQNDLSVVVTKVAQAVEKVLELGYDNPTEFEIITCATYLYFYEKNIDYAVIEVGLGGRLDSTNVITPLVSVITSISYDHMKILGDTLEKIALEKAGIIKEKVPVILYPQEDEVLKVFEKVCEQKGSPLIKVPYNTANLLETNVNNKQKISILTPKGDYIIELALLGKHQLLNCATAIFTIEELVKIQNMNNTEGSSNNYAQINKKHILDGLKDVKWPGRMEVMNEKPLVVIDGAHNIDGVTKLRESVETYFKYKDLVLILGILGDKEVEKMVKTIVPLAKKVIIAAPHSERAENPVVLKHIVEKYNNSCEIIEDYEEAYKTGLKLCEANDMLLICGSLYMIGDMRHKISILSKK